jgi:hypothetical protein
LPDDRQPFSETSCFYNNVQRTIVVVWHGNNGKVQSSSGQVSAVQFCPVQSSSGQFSSVLQFTSTVANYKTNKNNNNDNK